MENDENLMISRKKQLNNDDHTLFIGCSSRVYDLSRISGQTYICISNEWYDVKLRNNYHHGYTSHFYMKII
jgi:hypothetical protein